MKENSQLMNTQRMLTSTWLSEGGKECPITLK